MIDPALREAALAAKGFMPEAEGEALYSAAVAACTAIPGAPILEVGTYCGKSAIWLAGAARECSTMLFTVDHHRGSEENQPGWEWHDPSLIDPAVGVIDTLPEFRRTMHSAGLEDTVVAVVGRSALIARWWSIPLALCFIDGGHGVESARADYVGWAGKVATHGLLAIHDVFPDPADGGRPPYEEIYQPALESGWFREVTVAGSLRVLQRLG